MGSAFEHTHFSTLRDVIKYLINTIKLNDNFMKVDKIHLLITLQSLKHPITVKIMFIKTKFNTLFQCQRYANVCCYIISLSKSHYKLLDYCIWQGATFIVFSNSIDICQKNSPCSTIILLFKHSETESFPEFGFRFGPSVFDK